MSNAATDNGQLYKTACTLMPGGVNSPVRAFGSVGGSPRFIDHANGSTMTDVEGNRWIDYVCSWGPLILGHAHPAVVDAVQQAAVKGLSYGACHRYEITLAELIQKHMPHMQMLRLVNSGTEAAMSAVRLARAATGRSAIIKFEGCYHGHADSFLIAAGSGALTFGTPSSPGVTEGAAKDTLTATYNDLASVEACFKTQENNVACVIVEPVAANMGVVLPNEGFLQGLRKLCDQYGALLVFDEVITGFRLGLGGARVAFGVTADLTVLGKIIGGGMPIGAYGGRKDLMQQIAPTGPVYQAGTLSGNPVACAAGIATLSILENENPYPKMQRLAQMLSDGTKQNLNDAGIPAALNQIASMMTLFFGIESVTSYAEVMKADAKLYGRYHAAMLQAGVYLAPSAFEAMFVSAAHTEDDIQKTLDAQKNAFKSIA